MPQDNRSAMRKTIVARIATFDTSVPNPTPEQVSETIRLLDSAIEVFDGQPDGKTLKRLREELTKAPGGNIPAEQPVSEPNVPEQEQAPEQAPDGDPRLAQSAENGGDVMQAAVTEYIATAPYPAPDYSREAEVRSIVDPILDALAIVESDKNPAAVGDKGKAIGMFQAWPIAVREANRVIGRKKNNPLWTYKDRSDPRQARAMAKATLEYHLKRGTKDPVKLGGKWRDPYGKVAAREKLEGKTDQIEYERKLRDTLKSFKNQ